MELFQERGNSGPTSSQMTGPDGLHRVHSQCAPDRVGDGEKRNDKPQRGHLGKRDGLEGSFPDGKRHEINEESLHHLSDEESHAQSEGNAQQGNLRAKQNRTQRDYQGRHAQSHRDSDFPTLGVDHSAD